MLPAGAGGPVQLGPTALPDAAIICSCNNVTKGTIRGAVTEHNCTTVPEVKKCTKAGTTCGSCVKVLGQLVTAELEASGVVVDKGLCGCFSQTREELYEIVLALRINTYQDLLDRYGRDNAKGGDGCDICKPAVASIIASLAPTIGASGYVLDGEQAALQETNDHFLANLQKNGSYSVVPRIPGGEITPEGLIVIGEIARDFGLYTKITGGQRIDMFGARVEQLPLIWTRLVDAGFESGHAYGKSLRTVKSCVGQTWCRYGVQDSVRMAIDLELRYRGLRSPHKLKSAVSGCARECAEAQSKDFGIIATSGGWNLYVGGNGGATPRHADLLAQDLNDAELIKLIDRFLMFYIRTADRLERTSTWLERIPGGLDHVRDVVVEDSLGICEELESLMTDHVAHYRDEWSDTINDPEKLARFVSFVNAPDTPTRSSASSPSGTRSSPTCRCCPSACAPPMTSWKEAPSDDPGTRDDRPEDPTADRQQRRQRRRQLVHGLRPEPPAAGPRRGGPAAGRPAGGHLPRPRGQSVRHRQPRPVRRRGGPLPRPDRHPPGPPVRRLTAPEAALRPGVGPLPGRRDGGCDGVRGAHRRLTHPRLMLPVSGAPALHRPGRRSRS